MRVAEAAGHESQLDPEALERLAELLRRARRPVFVAGPGASLAGAGEALVTLGGLSGAVLAASANAPRLFAGDPWSIELSEGAAAPFASDLVRAADLVVGWGALLNTSNRVGDGELIGPDARVVRIDDDAGAAGECTRVDLRLVGEVRAIAQAVAASLHVWPRTTLTWRTPQLRRHIARHRR
jgi:thiamine pyrophosphate-dependent acetolactate synthase large subunit-like protein